MYKNYKKKYIEIVNINYAQQLIDDISFLLIFIEIYVINIIESILALRMYYSCISL